MRIDIRSRGFTLTEAFKFHVNRRLRFALDRFSERIGSVTVRVREVSAAHAGDDKDCIVEVNVIPLGRVVIGERCPDAYVAVDRATDRLGASVARVVKRAKRGRSASIRYLEPPGAHAA